MAARVQLVRPGDGAQPFARILGSNGEEIWRTSETYDDVRDVRRAIAILAELTVGTEPFVEEVGG